MPTLDAPLKYAGGKSYLSNWIIAQLPPRDSYRTFVDGCCGSCAVLLAHDPVGKSEIANDLDGRLTNFFRVLQEPKLFGPFYRRVAVTPFSEVEFRDAQDWLAASHPIGEESPPADRIEAAVRFFLLARMSRSGDQTGFATLTKGRLRRQRNEQVSAWLSSVERLPEVATRLLNVLILNRDLFTLLRDWDDADTVVYLDPPYHLEGKGGRVTEDLYRHDWKREGHVRLLETLRCLTKARILLSGYRTPLYDEQLTAEAGWRRLDSSQPLHSSGGKSKRRQTECLWLNY